MTEYEVLHGPFDVETHKKYVRNSLEVMLGPDGTVHYAVPSHQEFLIEKVKERHHWSQEQLMDACPPEYYFNFLTWLIMESGGYVPVWEKFVYGPVNQLQHDALQQLKREKLYLGNIPDVHLHK